MSILFLATSAANAGLITNGGFEAGFSGWTVTGANVLGVDYGIANTGVEAGTSSAWFGAVTGMTFISQIIPTTPGQEYEGGFWAANHAGAQPLNHFVFSWDGTTLLHVSDVGPQNWTVLQGAFTASTDLTELKFGFSNGPGWFLLDDVNITAVVPEPGAMPLCGAALGLLAFLQRRRGRATR